VKGYQLSAGGVLCSHQRRVRTLHRGIHAVHASGRQGMPCRDARKRAVGRQLATSAPCHIHMAHQCQGFTSHSMKKRSYLANATANGQLSVTTVGLLSPAACRCNACDVCACTCRTTTFGSKKLFYKKNTLLCSTGSDPQI
jgi:hypothetical protein